MRRGGTPLLLVCLVIISVCKREAVCACVHLCVRVREGGTELHLKREFAFLSKCRCVECALDVGVSIS